MLFTTLHCTGQSMLSQQNSFSREFPGDPGVRTLSFHSWGLSSIPGCRIKIPQAAQPYIEKVYIPSLKQLVCKLAIYNTAAKCIFL